MHADDIPIGSALDEEIARAEVYGLLAQLFYAPASAQLLHDLRLAATQAPAPGALLEEPWRQLAGAARAHTDEEIAAEYADLFGGVGKPEVSLFGSYYATGFLNDRPLVRLRGDLAALGLERSEAMPETEDHIAYLCEVMRYLIAGDDPAVCNLAQQARFFAAHLQPWVADLCDALEQHPKARFHAAAAAFMRAFMSVESQAFDLLPQ